MELDLDKPVDFGESSAEAQPQEDIEVQETPETPEAPKESEETEKPAEVEEKSDEEIVEKPRVTYSRFENVNRARREAEERAASFERQIQELREEMRSVRPASQNNDVPEWWKKMYGEGDNVREAWSIYSAQNEAFKNEIRQEALATVKAEQTQAEQQIEQNVEQIDENIEMLQESVGRELSEEEQSAILDIVDEYTPKNEDGKYVGLLPFDKAWEIYELRNQASRAPKNKSRNAVASLTSTPSKGKADERNTSDFVPGDWHSYESKLGSE